MVSKPGQGRRFDVDQALEVAMRMFWRHGYDGIGVAGLASGMGISVSSLYAAFGSKQELFEATVALYRRRYGNFAEIAFASASSARDFVSRILRLAVESFTADGMPKGCYIISSSSNLSLEAATVATMVTDLRNGNICDMTTFLTDAFGAEIAAAGTSAEAVSRLLGALLQGMSQQSLDGAGRAELDLVADLGVRMMDAVLASR